MDYKLFLPKGARVNGSQVILENGLTLPKYAFIAVPIIGTKGNQSSDILSELESNTVYLDTFTNTFTLNKKQREIDRTERYQFQSNSLSTSSNENADIKSNFDGYVNISELISVIKNQVTNIKETESKLVAYEQDIGYTTVREDNQINYDLGSIGDNDDYTSVKYQLSENLVLSNLLVNNLRPQSLQSQKGVSTKIIVRNLKNLALNIYEPIVRYLIPDQKNIEIINGFVEANYYSPDEESYIGESIQLRFPGLTSQAVYLIAKELVSLLFYSKLYLDYFLTENPRITIMLPSLNNPKNGSFGTRFEYNIIHEQRLVNIDKTFDENASSNDPLVLSDGRVNSTKVVTVPVDFNRDKIVLENFIKDSIKKKYVQSEEEAIKLAFQIGLNISDIVTDNYTPKENNVKKNISKQDDISNSENELNTTLRALLPNLVNCPPVSNGSVNGYPDQSIFPMMSSPQFRPITDPTMIYNPKTTAGQLNIPQHIRFNNPLLVGTVDGVTNKPEDGYIGEVDGKAVYSNRLGGLVAGLRLKGQQQVTPDMSLLTAVSNMVESSDLISVVSRLSKAIFGVTDPTGIMLGCVQVSSPKKDPDLWITMIASMMANATSKKTSPMTYDEIKLALDHLNGSNDTITRTPGGGLINEKRDPSKEQPNVITKTDQNANSSIKDIANTVINSVKSVIVDGRGVELETKSERKENQETTYVKYDSGKDHEDDLIYRGNPTASIGNTAETIMT